MSASAPAYAAPALDFYSRVLRRSLADGHIDRDMSVLVTCGGQLDRDAFQGAGMNNVTISNLSQRSMGTADAAPFAWDYQDAEALTCEDSSYDLAVVHAGLHHCASPHKGLLELYRVARKGVLVFESRDSLLIRMASRLQLSDDFELHPCVQQDFKSGGLRNTGVPNFVYRWTEREVRKTLHSFDPYADTRIHFHYGLRLPYHKLKLNKGQAGHVLVKIVDPGIRLFQKVFPRFCNQFAFFIAKPRYPDDLWPWFRLDGDAVVPDHEWIGRTYKKAPKRS